MFLTRIIRIVFGGLAGVMLLAALTDILWAGHLTIITPVSFGALLAVALAFLLQNLLVARERGEMLSRQALQLKQVAARLEAYLRSDDARAEDVLAELRALPLAARHAGLLAAIATAVEEIEYQAALAPLGALSRALQNESEEERA